MPTQITILTLPSIASSKSTIIEARRATKSKARTMNSSRISNNNSIIIFIFYFKLRASPQISRRTTARKPPSPPSITRTDSPGGVQWRRGRGSRRRRERGREWRVEKKGLLKIEFWEGKAKEIWWWCVFLGGVGGGVEVRRRRSERREREVREEGMFGSSRVRFPEERDGHSRSDSERRVVGKRGRLFGEKSVEELVVLLYLQRDLLVVTLAILCFLIVHGFSFLCLETEEGDDGVDEIFYRSSQFSLYLSVIPSYCLPLLSFFFISVYGQKNISVYGYKIWNEDNLLTIILLNNMLFNWKS